MRYYIEVPKEKKNMLRQVSLPQESWSLVAGASRYAVSDMGRIASLNYKNSGRVVVMRPAETEGYMRTMLQMDDGRYSTVKMHRLVAAAFCANPQSKPQVHHINHTPADNRAANLMWVTRRENLDFMLEAGRQAMNNGAKNGMSKLTAEAVLDIRSRYEPYVTTAKDLAAEYGVSTAAVKDILRGRTWKHVR